MQADDDGGRRALYIEILDHRRSVSTVPVFLEQVTSRDANVRRQSIAELGNVANPGDVGGMIKDLLAIKDAAEHDEGTRAVAAVCIAPPKKSDTPTPF